MFHCDRINGSAYKTATSLSQIVCYNLQIEELHLNHMVFDFHMVYYKFLLYNFVAITLLLFKLSKHCYDDQPIYTPIFKLFLYSVYPVAGTEVRFSFT